MKTIETTPLIYILYIHPKYTRELFVSRKTPIVLKENLLTYLYNSTLEMFPYI